MKITNVYIGGWFQRTMLQLTEIYDFLRDARTQLDLDHEKLQELRKNLGIGKIDYGVDGEEFVELSAYGIINHINIDYHQLLVIYLV